MGETVFNIEGLSIGDGSARQTSAMQLFAESARRTQPRFELNDQVSPAVTRICRMVDGMPLAIVLAAAWIDTLSVDEIAAEIEKSIDILETEKRDVPGRQRSVRAVIDSSWNQVDTATQDLLKRLSVFRGGFTRAAVQEAAGASLRGLLQLADKALLQRDPGTGRYSMHELLRQYAEEQLKLSVEQERAAHEAHAKYFADFMQTCESIHDQSKIGAYEVKAILTASASPGAIGLINRTRAVCFSSLMDSFCSLKCVALLSQRSSYLTLQPRNLCQTSVTSCVHERRFGRAGRGLPP
jgi:predicted ATPase